MPPSKAKQEKKEARKKAVDSHDSYLNSTGEACDAVLGNDAATLLQDMYSGTRSLPEMRSIMRRVVELSGTAVEKNDSDPYGDGDQSGVGRLGLGGESTRQILRELFSQGADLGIQLVKRQYSSFAIGCASGNVKAVERFILATEKGSEERQQLLERRESGLRLSPLLIAVAHSKGKLHVSMAMGMQIKDMDHVGVVRMLLRHGARPDARELTGKTMSHYGAGMMATEETLMMNDYCVDAAKTSAYFGKEVVVRNLGKDEYNGLEGVLGGYLAESGRRQVILKNGKELALLPKNIFSKEYFGKKVVLRNLGKDEYNGLEGVLGGYVAKSGRRLVVLNNGKELALQPKNIFSKEIEGQEESCIFDSTRNLVNEPDRLGCISFHEVFMSHRVDVATYLTEKYDASLDVKERGGMSIRMMSFMPQPDGLSPVNNVIRKHLLKKHRTDKKSCWRCQKVVEIIQLCSICQTAVYCNAKCQSKDWTSHKKQCTNPEEYSIELVRPEPRSEVLQLTNRNGIQDAGFYTRPDGVKVDELFWIKVQVMSDSLQHLIYDKTRTCTFHLAPKTPGHRELFEIVSAEKASMGKKTHVKASFDAAGNCKVYPNTATLKSW